MITLPIPQTFFELVWLGIGICFGRSFGKRLDYRTQRTEWYRKRGDFSKWLVKSLLDFLHHWWIGALLMLYAPRPELFWFGYGLFLDDLPDIPQRLRNFLKTL